MTTTVYDEKKMVTAGVVLIILHSRVVCVPNGQYLVTTPINVIGMANKQSEESAIANVVMNIFRAVRMPEMKCQIYFHFVRAI